MNRIIKQLSKAAFALLLIHGSCALSQSRDPETEVLWDKFGVPHVFANDLNDMYYAYGWAQMRNHADLILKLYGQARGKASEYWGPEYLKIDEMIGLYEIPEKASLNCERIPEPYKSYLDNFVKGINDFAAANTGIISAQYRQALPVTAHDIMSHVLRVLCIEFLAYDDLNAIGQMAGNGSNAYAIAPSRSASGNALLLTNPHLPWYDFHTWFEAHLKGPGFDAYGISMVGMPTLSMAFNKNLGWAFTVNTLDAADRYQLKLADGGYIVDGKVNPFRYKEKIIKVIQPDGSVVEVKKVFKYSMHGPVVAEKDGMAFALRIAGYDNFRIFEQYHKMASSENIIEFENAMKMLQNPMFNILYADRSGNILYIFNGNVPRRPSGDFGYWKGIVDGTRSDFIWDQYHTYEELPRILNPESGFLQNCNDPPWTTTWPAALNPEDYPSYMSPQFMHFRAQRAMNMIVNVPSISMEQLAGFKYNTVMEVAERFLDDLLEAAATSSDLSVKEAAIVLKNWDKSTDTASRGAVLFAAWFNKLRGDMFKVPWDPRQPSTTPDGLKDSEKAVDLLAEAITEVKSRYGSVDVEWGVVHRFRGPGSDYPANGGSGNYGIFRTIDYMDISSTTKQAVFGDTYIAVTEFGDTIKAQVLLGYGNATQPGNPHAGDQLRMASEKKLRPALLNRNDIMENLEEIEKLVVPK